MSSRKSIQVKRQTPCVPPYCTISGSVSPTSDTAATTTITTIQGSSSDTSTPTSLSGADTTSSTASPDPTATTTPVQTSTTTSAQSSSPSPADAAVSSTSNAGTIAGSVVGGVIFLVLLVLAILFYLRARKRKRTAPSSQFMNSLREGTAPVLRLDSGAEYTPTLPEKGGGHTHYPPTIPLPFLQNSYYTSPPMQNMRFPDELMMSDIPSARPSVEKPLYPQRFSSQASDMQHNPSTSVGSRRELWRSGTEVVSGESSPVRQSPPRADSVLHFAPRFSLDELPPQPLHLSYSPTSLQPLRRQPE